MASLKLQVNPTNQSGVLLNELRSGSTGPVTVMICRKWDVMNKRGDYMSTDFIVSDEQANIMHCCAMHNMAFKFVQRLEEGSLYTLSGFKVVPNKKDFRILNDSAFMLELNGSTNVRKSTGDVNRFVRHAFQICSFEQLVPTDNKYLVDVMGYIMYVGGPITKSTGAQTVEFLLTNESGLQIPVTLWGLTGEELIKKKGPKAGAYVCILTAMTAKKHNGELGVSSTSSTQILDDENLPPLKLFKAALGSEDLSTNPTAPVDVVPTVDSLAALLRWGRDNMGGKVKNNGSVVFKNTVEIVDIRTRTGWYLVTCSSGRCRKGLTRTREGFKCKGCDSTVLFPHIRYKLHLEVRDDTASVIVTLFDEPAEQLVHRPAKSLVEEEQQDDSIDDVLPPILRNLLGTRHVFEIKGHTYFHAGEYEGFNCSRVTLATVNNVAIVNTGNRPTVGNTREGTSSSVDKAPVPIHTPSKKNEPMRRKLRKLVLPNEAFDTDIGNQSEPNTYSEFVSGKGKSGDGFEPGKEIGRSSKKPRVVGKALSDAITGKYSEPNATSELGVTVEGSTHFGINDGDSEYVDLADDEFEHGDKVGHDSNRSRVVVSSPETESVTALNAEEEP